jgi:hypothetical protein
MHSNESRYCTRTYETWHFPAINQIETMKAYLGPPLTNSWARQTASHPVHIEMVLRCFCNNIYIFLTAPIKTLLLNLKMRDSDNLKK